MENSTRKNDNVGGIPIVDETRSNKQSIAVVLPWVEKRVLRKCSEEICEVVCFWVLFCFVKEDG